ncbi:MAG: hypothetical protein IPI23_16020 [Bacteroidetes bacterium]|nr:hypothetical protein [Bacteroidota bacterium]
MNKFLELMKKRIRLIFYIFLNYLAVNQTVAQTDYEIKKSPKANLLTNRPTPLQFKYQQKPVVTS